MGYGKNPLLNFSLGLRDSDSGQAWRLPSRGRLPRRRGGQDSAGHVRTTGADAVGEDWLYGLAIPTGEDQTLRCHCQRKGDGMNGDRGWGLGLGCGGGGGGGGNDTGSPTCNADAVSAGNVELRTQRRATVAGSANNLSGARRRANGGGRMREPGGVLRRRYIQKRGRGVQGERTRPCEEKEEQ